MFKNEVTHTTSCREASPGMGSPSPGFAYRLPFAAPPVLPQMKTSARAEPVTSTEGSVLPG